MSFQVWSTPWVMSASRKTICRTFGAALTCTPAIKHNRAKPMSELPSAMFLIADGNEFRFARFYIVYEGVQLVGRKSAHCLPGCRTCTRRIVQTWKRHGIRCKHSAGRNAHIFLQRIFHLHFHLKSHEYDLLIILLINIRYVYCDKFFLYRNLYL